MTPNSKIFSVFCGNEFDSPYFRKTLKSKKDERFQTLILY